MKKQNNIICTVLLVALIIAIPLAVFLIRDIDNDTWFMLNHGRYIMKNGLYPQYEPFTVHEGMEFTFQKWLSCILFWLIYKYLGKVALKLFLYGVYMAFVFAMYKLLEYKKRCKNPKSRNACCSQRRNDPIPLHPTADVHLSVFGNRAYCA